MYDQIVNDQVVGYLLLSLKVVGLYLAILWVAVAYWTFRDARRRSTQLGFQLLALMLVLAFFVPGLWVYLLLRPRTTIAERADDRLRLALATDYAGECPNCRGHVREDFIVCPSCGVGLRGACTRCSHALEAHWAQCPFCGLTVNNGEKHTSEQRVTNESIEQGQPAHA